MNRRNLIITIAAGGTLLTFLLVLSLWTPIFTRKSEAITLVTALRSLQANQEIDKEIREFQNLYPQYSVIHKPMEPQALREAWALSSPGNVVMTSDPGILSPEEWEFAPSVWTGSGWSLYYNRKVLQRIGLKFDDIPPGPLRIPQEMRTQRDFEAILDKLKKVGTTPLMLGSLYSWPQGLWLQHITALIQGADAAEVLASGEKPSGALEWQPAISTWKSWEASGWMNRDWKSTDWPEAVIRWARGEGAFTLLSTELLSTVPPENLPDIGWVNFPLGGETPWSIGSFWYLGIPKMSQTEGAEILWQFLTSPGVTARLSGRTGIVFFDASQGIRQIPSVTSASNSAFFQSLK